MEQVEIGDISTKDRLPAVFFDRETRSRVQASIDTFVSRNGRLPDKYRIAQFCFDRDEQICTADSREKLLAWDGQDLTLATEILGQLSQEDLSVVLRSHTLDIPDDNPAMQVKRRQQIDDFNRLVRSGENSGATQSEIWSQFYASIRNMSKSKTGQDTLDTTVVQLLKNITEQSGLLLIRPTFIYDDELKDEISNFRPSTRALGGDPDFSFSLPDIPDSFVGFRVLPIGEFAREKKTRMGYFFAYNPQSHAFEVRTSFPYANWFRNAEVAEIAKHYLGRSIDFAHGNQTSFHYQEGDTTTQQPAQLTTGLLRQPDFEFLTHVLSWQLPRIVSFENEIRQQSWLPQGLSNTHQFVIFPPQHLGDRRINTQYFDFHPYANAAQLREKANDWGQDLDSMPTDQKIVTFF